MNALSQFGVDPVKLAIQLLLVSAVFILPAIFASARVLSHYRSTSARFLWLVLIWMFPVVGAITALIQIPKSKPA